MFCANEVVQKAASELETKKKKKCFYYLPSLKRAVRITYAIYCSSLVKNVPKFFHRFYSVMCLTLIVFTRLDFKSFATTEKHT